MTTFAVRTRQELAGRVLAVALFVALTALTARIAIPLPFTPVPVTLQVLAVLLSGLVLGARAGALAQLTYLCAIAMGLPMTAAGVGGPVAFLGPTAGYLVGFVPAAFVVGLLSEWLGKNSVPALVATLAGVAVIYVCGAGWLAVWLGGNITQAWQLGVVPFVVVDAVKAVVAVAVASGGRRLVEMPG